MTGYVLSPRARADIDEIWDYRVQVWGLDQTESYIRDIQAAIEALVSDPSRGRNCDDIRAGYKKHPAGSHILFFKRNNGDVEVIRILHQRMDATRHL